MYQQCVQTVLVLVLSAASVVHCQGNVGTVTIGRINETSPEKFSFSGNDDQGTIPVYLTLINQTTGEPAPGYSNNVTVSCELLFLQDGYTRATYEPLIVDTSTFDGRPVPLNITYRRQASGRQVNIQCWGESDGNIPGLNSTEFSKQSSISQQVPFEIRPPSTVNFFEKNNIVANQQSVLSGSFSLALSETVAGQDLDVYCNASVVGNQTGDGLLVQLQNFPVVVPVGQDSTPQPVTYNINRNGSYPLIIACFGQSQGGGTQFQRDTSTGQTSEFMLDQGVVTILPPETNVYSRNFTAFLRLDAPAVQDVTFSCSADVANSTQEVNEILNNPICVIPTPTRPVDIQNTTVASNATVPTPTPGTRNVSGLWEVTSPVIVQRQSLYQTLDVTRTRVPTGPERELVVVTCCGTSDNDLKYCQKPGSSFAYASLVPDFPVNESQATSPADSERETTIRNPAYVEVSPCPCDLSTNCDTDCCCDPNCSDEEKSTFTCIPGVEGGYGRDEEPRRYCTSNYFNRPDWFPFMCVHSERSAFLGLFWSPKPVIRRDVDYTTQATAARPPYSYRNIGSRNPVEGTAYRQGVGLKTIIPASNGDPERLGDNFRMTLPQRSVAGQCAHSAPVRYLKDTQDLCVVAVTKDLCTSYSVLSARFYAEATTVTQPPYPKAPYVIEQGQTIALTTTNYFCATDLTSYVKSPQTIDEVLTPDGRSTFAKNITDGGATCMFDPETGAFTCNTTDIDPVLPLTPPGRCAWDNSFTRPPVPQFNEATNTCENAVISVYYNFTWSAQQVLQLNATYVLGDLPVEMNRTVTQGNTTSLEPYSTVLTQNFTVGFSHIWLNYTYNTTGNENFTEPVLKRPGRYQRSGNPGYEFDRPVLSGNAVTLNETINSTYVDFNDTKRLQLWQADTTGLCASASRSQLMFGENAIGSCMLRLTFSDLQDCDFLRRLVLNRQDALMSAGVISRGGDPDPWDQGDWLRIIREDLSSVIGNMTSPVTTEMSSTATESPTTTQSFTTETSTVPASNETESLYLLSLAQGVCSNIASGIHVDVMYAMVGRTEGVANYEITGANIRYTLSTWRMDCSGGNAPRCYDTEAQNAELGGQQYVQSFLISSSVNFIEVPAVTPTPKTKYEEEHDTTVCAGEACWSEIAYPFLPNWRGDSHGYRLAFLFVLVLVTVGAYFISRPWL